MALYTGAMADPKRPDFLTKLDESRCSVRVRAALERAREDAHAFERDPYRALEQVQSVEPPALRVAMGDPQAPLPRVLEILDRNDLLGDDGRVHPRAAMVSMGDHFDWGAPEERVFAAESGYALLS